MAIHLRSGEELEKMHRAGLIVYETLTALREMVRPGLTTMDLEKFAEEKIAGQAGQGQHSRVTAVILVCCAPR